MPGKGIPEIRWGTFYDAGKIIHVAPAIEKYLMKGHVLSMECKCGPAIYKYPKKVIIVHEIIH